MFGHTDRAAPGLLVVEHKVAGLNKLVSVQRLTRFVNKTTALAVGDYATIQVNRHEANILMTSSGDLTGDCPEVANIPMLRKV
ncbi:hypothetical protein D3C85_1625930 [compost metagenome]